MTLIEDILRKGYFPKELPPPFTTTSFASCIKANIGNLPSEYTWASPKEPKYISRPAIFNLARNGALRRRLSIQNPVNIFQSAKVVADNWSQLDAHYKKSKTALSSPIYKAGARQAISWSGSFDDINGEKLRIRAGKKYILRADIGQFYHSIYTHSIPWALEGKDFAKANRGFFDCIGNQLDHITQNGLDGQTKGIPIGPDTSLAIAELLMAVIDEKIISTLGQNYFRYVDDFEFGFSSFADAEGALGLLSELLGEFELELGSEKTNIIELPIPLEARWVTELKNIPFRSGKQGQLNSLTQLFDTSIRLLESFPNEAVVKYAIQRTTSLDIDASNWNFYQNIILNYALSEPGVLPAALDILYSYHLDGKQVNKDKLKECLSQIILDNIPRNHSSELAWAVWGHLLFGISLDHQCANLLAKQNDPVLALLCLDARSQKLIDKSHTFDLWKSWMTRQDLRDRNWLVTYEAKIKKWLPQAVNGKNYLTTQKEFSLLKDNAVQFYDPSRTKNYQPGFKQVAKKSMAIQKLLASYVAKFTAGGY